MPAPKNPWVEVGIDAGQQYGTLRGYVRQKDVTYFGIDLTKYPVPEPAGNEKHIVKTGVTRKIFEGPADATGKTITYDLDYKLPPSSVDANFTGKKSIRVPYAATVKTDKGAQRYATIRVQGGVSMSAISEFLFNACTTNKPTYFLSPNGRRFKVVNITGDVNPAPAPTPAPTP